MRSFQQTPASFRATSLRTISIRSAAAQPRSRHPRPSIPSHSITSTTTTTTTTSSSSSFSSSALHNDTSSAAPPTTPTTPITSLLIANRGEIALRIARTATAMGIRTTTVYTAVDAHAPHARATPHSLSLGPGAAGYLDGARLVALARAHGIAALHPGYGFLSENAAFARRCEEAGVLFVGPPAQAMADMGDKARSKEIMTAAGVPCVPGYHGPEQSAAQLKARAAEVGYPVLLKSVKGGGGKGMRVVRAAPEFDAQLQSARAEARASFGDGGEVMLVERYVVRPRHVEVQVFADRHGHCVALGERDCSVQRRHQKVLEESPAPALDDALRHDLWDKARTAALAVGYVGAGTVEFILDRDTGDFFFMEMNTRLQVEHPVSEMVTGTDLVEWQFRVAAGEPLPLTQAEVEARIRARGHAVEARIYAEKPARAFFPDSGRLVHLATPATIDDVRIDAGFVQGDTVSEAYDGMIAKLIVRGRDRETAIRKLELALREYEVVGLSTNIEFLKRLCRSRAFIEGDVETGFIDKWREELFAPGETPDEVLVQAALGLLGAQMDRMGVERGAPGLHGAALGFGEPKAQSERRFVFQVRDDVRADEEEEDQVVVEVEVAQLGPHLFHATVTRAPPRASGAAPAAPVTSTFDQVVCQWATTASVAETTRLTTFFPAQRVASTLVQDPADPEKLTVFQHGTKTELRLLPPEWHAKALGLKDAAASVVAPMPCKILRNEVAEGQAVEKGAPLVV